MKKVINIILLVVLGVSLSGCEWWDEPGFGIDGKSDHYDRNPMDTLMTNIAQYGCEGEVVDFFSFVVGRNMGDTISPTINIDKTYVEFSAMKKYGKDSVAMNVKINGEEGAFKFHSDGGDPVSGVEMKSFIDGIHILGSKSDDNNNQDFEWDSEFFLWDTFEDEGKTYIVLLTSKSINIEFYSHKGNILKSDEVEKIINDTNKVNGKDYHEISVMGAMNGVDKTAYVIDNRVYIRNSLNNYWSYFCNYSVANPMSTDRVETMILIEVNKLKDDSSDIVSIKKQSGKKYFMQTKDKQNINRFYLISHN